MFATAAALQPDALMPVPQAPKSTSGPDFNILHTQEMRAHILASQQSSSCVNTQAHQHQHTHQHVHQHTFTPMFHHFSTLLPAASIMETHDSDLIQTLSRGTPKPPSFIPFTGFHKTLQGAFQPKKQGRWGAMHVCIAWQIYYHKKIKKMQMKSHQDQELAPEFPSATSLSDVMRQHKELVQSCCTCPDLESPRGQSPYGNGEINFAEISGTIKKEENINQFHKSCSPERCCTSSPVPHHSHATKRDKLDWDDWVRTLDQPWHETEPKLDETQSEKNDEKHGEHQLDSTPEASPITDKSVHRTLTPETHSRHGGSHRGEIGDRKRQLECESLVQVKRLKQEVREDDQQDSSESQSPHPGFSNPFPPSKTHISSSDPSSSTMPVQHVAIVDGVPALYSTGSLSRTYSTTPAGFIPYPGADKYPYTVPSWEALWGVQRNMDLPSNQDLLKRGYFLNRCEAVRMPEVSWWHRDREAFHSVPATPINFPVSLRRREGVYLRESGFLHSLNENCYPHSCRPHPYHSASMGHLGQPGFLTTVYPHMAKVSLAQQRVAASTRVARLYP